MSETTLPDGTVEPIKKSSLDLLKALQVPGESSTGGPSVAQRQFAYARVQQWLATVGSALARVGSHFTAHRGEAIASREIEILVELLKQLRDDYVLYFVRDDSALAAYDAPSYQEVAELDHDEKFWNSWEPLFQHADAYREGATAKPGPGQELLDFELVRREKSSQIRRELARFLKQYIKVLDSIKDLPKP